MGRPGLRSRLDAEWVCLRESLWVLYSITVVGGRLRTRFRVSRIFPVVIESCAVRFQTDIMSSWKRTDITAPQISSPTINCSPSIAKIIFSQQREASPFLKRTIHFPPFLLAESSHIGLIPSLKICISECEGRSTGRKQRL